MTKKIVLGVVAFIATLLMGLAIGSYAKTGNQLGASGGYQTTPLHVTNSTNWDTGYFWGDLEVRQNLWVDGNLYVSGTSAFATSSFSALTASSVSSTNGLFTNVTTTNLTVTNCIGCGGGPSTYAMWYGLTAGTGNSSTTDYPATVAVKTSAGTGRVPFPRLGPGSGDVPTSTASGTAFTLPAIGTYHIQFTVHTTEPGELQLELNGAAQPQTTVDNANPTSGGLLFSGNAYLTTTSTNSTLAVINPAGNTPALTITPADGASTNAVAQVLTIERIK